MHTYRRADGKSLSSLPGEREMLLSLPLQIATKCACPSVPLGLMRHVETAGGRGRDAAAAVEDISVEPRGGPDDVVAAQILLTMCNCTPISAGWRHQADPISVTPCSPEEHSPSEPAVR